jgi:antirestriction protein ArdC
VATTIVSQSVRVNPNSDPSTPRPAVYEIITSQILAELEKGQVPWRKPWRTLPPANLVSKKPYRGINTSKSVNTLLQLLRAD